MTFEISTRLSGDVTIVDLKGRATIGANSDLFNLELRKLIAAGARKLLLNLAHLSMVDSSGVAIIVGTYVSLARAGGGLKLVHPTDRVREVLKVMRLLPIVPIFEGEPAALAAFRDAAQSASMP